MEFSTISQLQDSFTKGLLSSLPEEISITGVKYRLFKGTEYPLDEMINKNLKGIVLYSLDRNTENVKRFKKFHSTVDESIMQDRVALIWAMSRSRMHPVSARFISAARSEPMVSTGVVREANISDDRIIGHNISIMLSGINDGQQLPAKVDTGAHICSLHATDIEQKRGQGMVSFIFGSKRYTMPAIEVQAIQTADNGIENRPVVALDVIVPYGDADTKNRVIKKVKFNLNDRSEMPDKILLGQNFIKAGDFVVVSDNELKQPQIGESEDSIDWGTLQEDFKDVDYTDNNINEDIKTLLDIAIRLNNKE